jgi:hypothetical protein
MVQFDVRDPVVVGAKITCSITVELGAITLGSVVAAKKPLVEGGFDAVMVSGRLP